MLRGSYFLEYLSNFHFFEHSAVLPDFSQVEIQLNVRKIVSENPKMIEFTNGKGTSSGDAFLIATAMKYGLIIISEENQDKPTKIPQISKSYGIESVNITGLCDKEHWEF